MSDREAIYREALDHIRARTGSGASDYPIAELLAIAEAAAALVASHHGISLGTSADIQWRITGVEALRDALDTIEALP